MSTATSPANANHARIRVELEPAVLGRRDEEPARRVIEQGTDDVLGRRLDMQPAIELVAEREPARGAIGQHAVRPAVHRDPVARRQLDVDLRTFGAAGLTARAEPHHVAHAVARTADRVAGDLAAHRTGEHEQPRTPALASAQLLREHPDEHDRHGHEPEDRHLPRT